jgi:cytosine/adenosine deaminase-related metal-dependent hydrolase
MRKFTAHRIYPVNRPPISFGIIETDDDGTIVKVRETGGKPVEEAGLEFYPGIIIPGLVNAHCHLELSHLAGRIPVQTGLAGFVSAVSGIRKADTGIILKAAGRADRILYEEGISAVGDISNNSITLEIKQKSPIRYHTFIEVFGLDPSTGEMRFQQAIGVAESYTAAGLPCSISPHSPYSVGVELWERISGTGDRTGRISIHHDESPEERELLDHGAGPMADSFRSAGFDLGQIPEEAADIFRLLRKYADGPDWILVHNTLTDPMSVPKYLKSNTFWVLCPRSNRYIENLLPDLNAFAQSGLTVCLGTDSLASNSSLSVLDEMKAVQEAAPDIDFQTILRWGTFNGALALGMEKELGSIEPGKKPGLVNIPLFDWEQDRVPEAGRPVRLV